MASSTQLSFETILKPRHQIFEQPTSASSSILPRVDYYKRVVAPTSKWLGTFPWKAIGLGFLTGSAVLFFLYGFLLLTGILQLQTAPVALSPTPPPSLSPPPFLVSSPMSPGTEVIGTRSLSCHTFVAGIYVSLKHNGKCEDGGIGSVAATCELGSDDPDCPIRTQG